MLGSVVQLEGAFSDLLTVQVMRIHGISLEPHVSGNEQSTEETSPAPRHNFKHTDTDNDIGRTLLPHVKSGHLPPVAEVRTFSRPNEQTLRFSVLGIL